jgi:hypothetical protein
VKLYHFSGKKINFDPNRKYTEEEDNGFKPHGLWVSDESDFGWAKWCDGENWNLEGFKYGVRVDISDFSNILIITNPDDLRSFDKKYRRKLYSCFDVIDWTNVKKIYGGIIITPYIYSCRFEPRWYYSWDCASGCIWDLTNVKIRGIKK